MQLILRTEIVAASDVAGERTNINFLEGSPGDTHLVYTYQQKGNTYKAVENSTEDFRNVECQIFQLSEDGNYVENSTQRVSIDNEGTPKITIESAAGNIERRTTDLSSSALQSDSVSRGENWEWITEYANGSRGGLKGLAISALISVIATIATYYTAGALSAATVYGASTIASGLFGQNAEKVYYYAIYNWRHSPKNYLVIDETEWTEFYLDSSHIYSLGHTYACIIIGILQPAQFKGNKNKIEAITLHRIPSMRTKGRYFCIWIAELRANLTRSGKEGNTQSSQGLT